MMDDDNPFAHLSCIVSGPGENSGEIFLNIDKLRYSMSWDDSIRLSAMLVVQSALAAARKGEEIEDVYSLFGDTLNDLWDSLFEQPVGC